MEDWALTIRKNAEPREVADYVDFWAFMLKSNRQVQTVSMVCEQNKNGQVGIHQHAYIKIPKGYFRKRITCYPGYHIKLEKITNLEGWIRYMNKDQSLFNRFKNSVPVAHHLEPPELDEHDEKE